MPSQILNSSKADSTYTKINEIPRKNMINVIKEETNRQVNKSIIKMINQPKEDTNKHLTELRKTIQAMKDNFRKRYQLWEKIKQKFWK